MKAIIIFPARPAYVLSDACDAIEHQVDGLVIEAILCMQIEDYNRQLLAVSI